MTGRSLPSSAVEAWLPTLYDCLRELAARALRRETDARTLQPTALVHEAYLRLVDAPPVVREEAHFMALAARVVRQVLVDHARARDAKKRGGDWGRITLHPGVAFSQPGDDDTLDLLALEEALAELEGVDARAARVVELRFFSGLSVDDTAAVLEISSTTVDVDWRFARAWLSRALDGPSLP
jgi:RNA polymerase sigma factor (TIGR02999 family)